MRFLKFGLMRLKRRFWRRNTQPEVGQYWEDKVRYWASNVVGDSFAL